MIGRPTPPTHLDCQECGKPIPAERGFSVLLGRFSGTVPKFCSNRCKTRSGQRRFRGLSGPGRRMPWLDANTSKGRVAELLVLNSLRSQGLLVVDVADRARQGKYRSRYDLAVVLPDGPDGGFCRIEVKSLHTQAASGTWLPTGSFEINRRHTLGTLPFDVLAVVRPDGSFKLFPSLDAWRSGSKFDPGMVSLGDRIKRRQRKADILLLQHKLPLTPDSKDT